MEENVKKEGFSFTYSAKEQEEIKRIRQKYLPQEPDKMEQLRKLDESAANKAIICSLVLGVSGALLMGCGMSLMMTDFGEWFGMHKSLCMVIGIVVGVIGMAIAGVAYPVYSRTLKSERERIAPEILRLTEELMK